MIKFLSNKYTLWYFSIIEKANQKSTNNNYFENHHIIPKSLGGSNQKSNFVKLSGREHFICHWLLTKMLEDPIHRRKMYSALHYMLCSSKKHKDRYTPQSNSRVYELLRAKISFASSGMNSPRYGVKASKETKAKIADIHRGKIIPDSVRRQIAETLRNVSARQWKIEFDDGRTEIVLNLKKWCVERNIIISSLKNTMNYGTFYNGMKVSRL